VYVNTLTGKGTPELAHLKVVIEVLNQVAGDLAARDFGPLKLQACQQAFVARGYRRRTVNDYVNRARRAIRWAVSNEILPGSVLHALMAVPGLRKGRTKAPEGRVVTAVDEAAVRATLPHLSRQLQAVVELLFLTGARPSEVLNMRPSEIDTEGIDFGHGKRCWLLAPSHHKNSWRDQDRRIPLGPRAQQLLQPFLSRKPEEFCFSPIEAEKERNAARRVERKSKRWPSHVRYQRRKRARAKNRHPLRDRYSPSTLYHAIAKACKAARVQPWFPYQLRHAAGTRLARQFGQETAGEILGHRDARTTSRYVDPDVAAAARAMLQTG
jgi:integrase